MSPGNHAGPVRWYPSCQKSALYNSPHKELRLVPSGIYTTLVGRREFQRYIDQLAVNAIRPAVIRTGKGASVAAICITHTHGPVAALVEKRLNAAVFLTHYDNRIFPM